MKKLYVISLLLMIVACMKYTYPKVDNGKIMPTESGIELAQADTLEEAEQKSAQAIETVVGVVIPKKNKYQDYVIGIGLGLGGIMIVLGIVLALPGQRICLGILTALAGALTLLIFTVLYASLTFIQEHTMSIVIVISLAVTGVIAYYAHFNKSVIYGLLKGFEVQKNKLWDDPSTAEDVKLAQGKAQAHIHKLSKKL